MISTVSGIALIIIGISFLVNLFRVFIGPSVMDRVLALDNISTNVVAFLIVFAIYYSTRYFIDAMMVIAILSFIGTVAIAKYLAYGRIIEKNSEKNNANRNIS